MCQEKGSSFAVRSVEALQRSKKPTLRKLGHFWASLYVKGARLLHLTSSILGP